jgi:prophage regulatory protein
MSPDNTNSPFLLKPDRRKRVPLSDSTVDRLEAKGLFPKRVKLGVRKVGWRLAEIEAWEQSLASSSTDRAA